MKFKLRPLFLLLTGLVLIYSACHKTYPANGQSQANQAVAVQVGLNLYNSLFNDIGAVNLGGGIGTATSYTVKGRHKVLQDTANAFCSLLIDTTFISTDTAANGNIYTHSGNYNFSFACTNNVVSSYTTTDSVSIAATSPTVNYAYKVKEGVTVTALTPGSSTSTLFVAGTLNSNGVYSLLTGGKGSGIQAFSYVLSSVTIDPTIDDITSGSVSFNTTGQGPDGDWSNSGTIVFNGSYMATITINGKAYSVNLQTGAVQ